MERKSKQNLHIVNADQRPLTLPVLTAVSLAQSAQPLTAWPGWAQNLQGLLSSPQHLHLSKKRLLLMHMKKCMGVWGVWTICPDWIKPWWQIFATLQRCSSRLPRGRQSWRLRSERMSTTACELGKDVREKVDQSLGLKPPEMREEEAIVNSGQSASVTCERSVEGPLGKWKFKF